MNNWWEDLEMSNKLKKFHEQVVTSMNLPQWLDMDCPRCNHKLDKRAIRSIQMLFNARNIGDIAVEFCCENCRIMDTIYFRDAAKNVAEFTKVLTLSGDKCHNLKPPILEEKMYALQYNNLVEKMVNSNEES